MNFKVLLILVLLCLASTKAVEKKSQHVQPQDMPADVTESADLDTDLNTQPTFWRFWKPRRLLKFGRAMFNNKSPRSLGPLESIMEKHHGHRDGKRKLKNKVKFLFKIHQFET